MRRIALLVALLVLSPFTLSARQAIHHHAALAQTANPNCAFGATPPKGTSCSIGDYTVGGALSSTDAIAICQVAGGCFASSPTITYKQVPLLSSLRSGLSVSSPLTYSSGTGVFGLGIDSTLSVVAGQLHVVAGGGGVTIPNAPIMSGNGSVLGGITPGTGLSLAGTFPNQTLNATGGGAVSITAGDASMVVAPSPLTGTGTLTVGGPSHLTTFTAGTVPMGAGSSPFAASEILDTGQLGVVIGAATGGQKGAGSVNMQSCFINNVPCAAGSSTAFGSITGGTNSSAVMVVGTGASIAPSGSGAITATTMPATGLTGTINAAQMPAITGDVTAPAGSTTHTLATVNSNVGPFTNANITVNAKGLITAAANGTGGGGGTVGSGTGPQIAQYPAGTGTVVGGVTVSGDATLAAGGALTIAANAVTYAKMQTETASTLLGNPTGALAVPSPITLSSNFAFAAGVLNLAGTIPAAQMPGYTGDVTSTAGATVNTITTNAVTNAKAAQMAANTIKGNPTGAIANAADMAAPSCPDTAGNHLNWTSGTGLSCGTTSSGSAGGVTFTAGTPNVTLSPAGSLTSAVTIGTTVPTNTQAGTSYTVASTDAAKTVLRTAASAQTDTVPAATGTFGAGFGFDVNTATNGDTLTSTSTINGIAGATGIKMGAQQVTSWLSDGTNWHAVYGLPQPVTQTGTTFVRDDMTWQPVVQTGVANTFTAAQTFGTVQGAARTVSSGTTDTISATDCGKTIYYNLAAFTVTVPSSAAPPVNTKCDITLETLTANKVTVSFTGFTAGFFGSADGYTGTQAIALSTIVVELSTVGTNAVGTLMGHGT